MELNLAVLRVHADPSIYAGAGTTISTLPAELHIHHLKRVHSAPAQ